MVRKLFLLFWSICITCAGADVPTPKQHLGYEPGTDYKLADYEDIIGYFQKLAASSNRIKLVEFGKTAMGKPMYMAFISSPENLRNLDGLREGNRRLALGLPTPEEARRLAKQGKVFVWIDSGLHASEVAPAQHSPVLAYRMITDESEETQRIRDKVVLLQVPVINPDGLDWISHWYRQNVGTPYELAPLPSLYQKYSGHDNNRDWYMMNLEETRNVSRLLYRDWFPQIVYNQHQAPAFPARIFVPPYAEPLNPNIPAAVMEGINLIGSAMKERFATENKPGILSYYGFDAWWNGGLRSVPAFHNMHGILTETALNAYATPRVYKPSDLPERFANGIPTKEPTVFYQRPWMGGKWGVRDAIDYMLTADFAILDLASTRTESFLFKAWDLARASIATGAKGPYAYIISPEQWDRSAPREMLRRLQLGGLEVRQARAPFQTNAKTYPAGTFVLLAAQPFRSYLVDLLEPQKYPELRAGTSGPTKRPYDIAGWTLSMQMGVSVDKAEAPFNAELQVVEELPALAHSNDHKDTSSFLALAEALANNKKVRWARDGKPIAEGSADWNQGAFELRRPRLAVYESWTANIDGGWTQWTLDTYKIPYTLVHNGDIGKQELRSRFDTVLLPSQSMSSILHGFREGESTSRRSSESPAVQRPEFTGGIGLAGAAALQRFVEEGGTLIALDDATELPSQLFPIGVRPLISNAPTSREDAAPSGFYSPGSILRISVDNTNPIAFGMPPQAYAFVSGGQAWETTLLPDWDKGDREVHSVARYAARDLLASGWISGDRAVLGRSILVDVRLGKGRVVLFGFRPQFRGQTYGTFKFLLNAIYLGSAKTL